MTDEPITAPEPTVDPLAGSLEELLVSINRQLAMTSDQGFADLIDYLAENDHGPECAHPDLCRRAAVMAWATDRQCSARHLAHVLGSAVELLLEQRRPADETEGADLAGEAI